MPNWTPPRSPTAWEGLRIDSHVRQDLLGAGPVDLAASENHRKTMGKPWENRGKATGKPEKRWENRGETVGKPWFKMQNKKPLGTGKYTKMCDTKWVFILEDLELLGKPRPSPAKTRRNWGRTTRNIHTHVKSIQRTSTHVQFSPTSPRSVWILETWGTHHKRMKDSSGLASLFGRNVIGQVNPSFCSI